MNNVPLAIGIDLGTTNSAISIWSDGKAELIPNALGKFLTPSVISIDEEMNISVGEAARSRLITRPDQTVASFKRFLGTDKKYRVGNTEYTPTDLCALLLKALKEDAESFLAQSISDVVISVPAYFSDQQRKQVKHAAELAGLNAVRLINEPTAACLAYSLHETHDRQFLVFDLGGGTFDVTIVEHQDSFIEVHASTGDNFLGGDDFTTYLAAWVCTELNIDLEKAPLQDKAKIITACEKAKKQNSDPLIIELPSPYNQKLEVSQQQLDVIWDDLLTRLARPIRQALKDARINPDDIDELIFVGGATRLRAVQQMATRLIGRFGKCSIDPDFVVALGAATQAACRLRNEEVEEVILTDVCPFSLGISSNRDNQTGVFSPIIERNTVVPTSRVERYYTASDDQEVVRIAIYQGERLWVKENIFIQEFEIEVPKGKAGEEAIDVRFSYDINGLLEVDVTVLSTGATTQKIIDQSPMGITEEDKKKSRERLALLKHHPRDEIPNITLMEKLNQLYETSLNHEREHVEKLIFYFTEAINTQDKQKIREAAKEIQGHLSQYDMS